MNKMGLSEAIPFILILGAYILFYYPSIMAEHAAMAPVGAMESSVFEEDGAGGQANGWNSVKSSYFTVYYRPDANLKSINRKLRKRQFYFNGARNTEHLSNEDDKIARRMDVLYGRAKELLGMYPRVRGDVKIKIFKNREELNAEYARIFGEKKNLKSFFIYKYNTIYTNENDISDSVIAHEMGHVVVDHYFAVRPPEKVREMIAQYVDLHLEG